MKILVIQDYLRSGGTERQSVLLARAFARAGHDATLLTFRPGGVLARTESPTADEGMKHLALQPRDFHLDWFAPGLARSVAALAPDVVLCMGRMANCYAGNVQKKFPRIAVVATMRTGKPLPWLFRRSLRQCRHIVANSVEARDHLVSSHRIAAGKISVIHNSLVFPVASVDARPVSGAKAETRASLRATHGATSATMVLLCVAMFRPEKNQRELIEIVAGLPANSDWQLWLAGDGPARAACEQLAAARMLGARVKFLGFHRDPSAFYAAADVAVHASASESLSNFLIEAQAHGLPAVAYQAQGIRESFLPDRTGWVIARDDRAGFRTALNRLRAEPIEMRNRRAAEARAYARDTFDPKRQVAAYLELFATLAQNLRHDEQAAH